MRDAFVWTASRMSSGMHERDRRRPEAVDDDEPPHELGERAGDADRLTAAERMRDHADRTPDHVADQQREVEVQQRPREAGVERSAVAVATEVECDRVVAERGDPRREVVEHAAVVVGAVQEQHRRCGRITPAPEPQGRAVDLDELGPIRFAQRRARRCPLPAGDIDSGSAMVRRSVVAQGSWECCQFEDGGDRDNQRLVIERIGERFSQDPID